MRMKTKRINGETKLISLRKQICGLIFWLCMIIAIVWFIGLIANIRSFQNLQDEKRMAALKEYADALDNSIVLTSDVVGNIFMTNVTFDRLSQYKNASEEVECIHDLLSLLQIQININPNLSAMFIYYGNMERVLYYLNENVSFDVKEKLKKAGKIIGNSDSIASAVNAHWTYVAATEEGIFYNVFLKKKKAAIAGCVSMGTGLPVEKEAGATYGVVYKNELYKTFGTDKELTAAEMDSLYPGRNRIRDTIVYVQKLEKTDMAVVEILTISPWLYINAGHIILCLFGLACIFLAIKINQLVAFEITRPLEDMNNALSKIRTGVWEVHFDVPNRIEEIESVRNAVYTMVKEIEQYKIKSYEEQLEKQETELQYLRLQLAPHFYTNCLKNAYYMLMLKEYENVERYLLCLSAHLRYLLQKNVKMVELNEEKEFVLNYIELQKQMTEKSYTLDMQIDEAALEVEVPILLLQTFVENSIKYGRGTEQTDLRIQIRIRCKILEFGDCLDIKICDNGHGYPEKILSELNRGEMSQEGKFGVGIINLQHRMKIHYGENVSWYFSNSGGACSNLIIPVKGRK